MPIEEDEDDSALTDECPEPNGYFADAYQCDKYYECRDGAITEKLCPDGMVFNDYSSQHEKCDLPFGIDCSQRPELRKSLRSRTRKRIEITEASSYTTSILHSRETATHLALSQA